MPASITAPPESAILPHWQGVIHHYRQWLPVTERTPIVTLFEGNTPLISAPRLAARLGVKHAKVWLKFEGANPTGSFKDRGMTLAITKAVERGSRAVICASTGNTSASAAAYSRRAGVQCVVLIPDGNIALGKLSQALMHQATVLAVQGNFDQALELVRKIAEKHPIEIVNSLNPFRLQGQKTGAFEICDALGHAPTHHCIPVGNAGNITAYWMGYKEYCEAGRIESKPKMIGFQAAGAAPIVAGHPIEHPETFATAIRIGNPVSWKMAVAARDESGGSIEAVTDDEIAAAYKLIAGEEGILCEPASAASVAGMLKKADAGYFKKESRGGKPVEVVCILTGHGLKDPNAAIKHSAPPIVVPAEMSALMEHIHLA
ncbi:threonine synthase [Candidatus Sumerlaeota bacterium]|nr:threonine synthase [Candidatus Sumerlaeota bacterium]